MRVRGRRLCGSNRFRFSRLCFDDLLEIQGSIWMDDQASIEIGQGNRVDMEICGVIADIEVTQINRGLVHANLSLFVDASSAPVLATALGAIDVFAIYGLILAALGLRKVARMSSGAAWTIVVVLWVIGVILKVAFAAISGSAFA